MPKLTRSSHALEVPPPNVLTDIGSDMPDPDNLRVDTGSLPIIRDADIRGDAESRDSDVPNRGTAGSSR